MREATREMRDEGRDVLEALRDYMRRWRGGQTYGRHPPGQRYAAVLSADGLTLPQAVRGFLYFSDFVTNSVLTWSEITPPRSASERANHAAPDQHLHPRHAAFHHRIL